MATSGKAEEACSRPLPLRDARRFYATAAAWSPPILRTHHFICQESTHLSDWQTLRSAIPVPASRWLDYSRNRSVLSFLPPCPSGRGNAHRSQSLHASIPQELRCTPQACARPARRAAMSGISWPLHFSPL